MELFRLLGKIAIDNAEAKKALQETSQEGQHTESKLGKAFGAIGKGAAVVGKTIAVGLAAGATACVGLATAAIKSYGDYEQLVGGVETLFGTRGAKSVEEYAQMVGKSVDYVEAEFGMLQQAQSLVMDNAAQAYKTAGLSVNDYMESVNGIAAALNQSSASQLESAELANQAVIDMSDNAAKMGTSMEAIQNAYAGFSKQNYTMLDNLKLGYGGTKEEMQRLLDDAQKISGIKYDISSFADVTQAIHVMQEEMGIAGTTAKEASGTIQGSFGMLKGSWSNLMTGLSDPEADLSALISNVFESVTTFAQNLIPRITEVFSGIATALSTLVPMIASEIPNLLNQVLPPLIEGAVAIVNGLVEALPSVLGALLAAIPALIDAVMQIVDALIGALPGVLQSLLAALPTLIPQLIDGIVSAVMMLVEMLPQIIQPIIDNLPTIIISIVDALVSNLPVLIEGLIQLCMAIVTALPQIIQALVDALPTVVQLIVDALIQNIPLLIAGFIQVVGGLVAALPQIFSSLIEGIGAIFTGLWEGIKTIFSPITDWFSNMWASLGNVPGLAQMKTFIETLWSTISNNITTYVNAIKNVVTTVWDAIKDYVSTVLNAFKNIITTVWEAIKTYISNAMKLIASILKGDWEGVKTAISNILNAIKSVITSIWDGIKSVISSALNGIKSVVSSVWEGIKSVISSVLNGIINVVTTAWNGVKNAIVGVITGIKTTVTKGFNDVKDKAINAFKAIPGKLKSVGTDIVKGLWNGINNAKDWIIEKIKGFGDAVLGGLKSFFGIKSPSTVMRDQVGREIARGVAVGIEKNTNEAISAMEDLGTGVTAQAKKNLAKEKDISKKINSEILKLAKQKLESWKQNNELTAESEVTFWGTILGQLTEGTKEYIEAEKKFYEAKNSIDEELLNSAQKKLENYKVYNELTLADEVGFWDELRLQLTEGTDARIKADKSYFEAKASLNNQFIAAEESLQTTLAGIYQKIVDRKKELLNNFNLTEKYVDGNEKPASFMELNDALDSQIDALELWDSELKTLEERIGGTALYEEIAAMGLAGLSQVQEVNEMTDYQINMLLEKHKKREELAGKMAEEELSAETFAETQKAYQDFADACGVLGLDVVDKTAVMQQGVTDALTAMKEAFENFEPKMKMPHFKIEGSLNVETGSVPYVSVEWYKKAMSNAAILTNPTIFGYDAKTGKYLGGGEAGNEVVAGEQTLMTMIQNAVAEQNSTITIWLQKVFEILSEYFPNMLLALESPIAFNADSMAVALASPMNRELGKLSTRKDRGR